MLRDFCDTVYHNKNVLMLFTVFVYIMSVVSVLTDNVIVLALLFTILFILFTLKKYFPNKVILIWTFIFYIGILNTSIRIKETDDLLNLAPVNAEIYGKIVSIPQIKEGRQSFLFSPQKIEYDEITQLLKNEKVMVFINTEDKLHLYDTLNIRGRLSVPFHTGNPSQFDYSNYLRTFGVYSVFYARNPYSMKDSNEPCYQKFEVQKPFIEKVLVKINNYRERILGIHSKYLESPNLEILGGIVFGSDAVNPPEKIKQSFVNSGLLHILAASGMNVAFIYSFFFFFMRLMRVNFKVNTSICILMVITYVLMTGLGASVLRAALMLIFVLIGKLIDRDANSIALLSFVAFLMLIFNPMYLCDIGFQLSFVVTFGLLLMMPYIVKGENKFVNWLIGTFTIPVIAQIWVIPIQIFYFSNISIYSVFANIMSVLVVSLISFGGFISSLLSMIAPLADSICHISDSILNPLITLLVNISDFWGQLPNSTIQTTHPHFIQIVLYYLILINLVALFNKNLTESLIKKLRISLPILITILFVSMISIPNKNLEITAFNVGNADAFLIKTPDNKYMMIDTAKSGYNGGKTQAEMIIIKYLKDKGIKELDNLIVTHFDNDHSGGAVDFIKDMKVKNLYVNSTTDKSQMAQDIYKTAKECNTKIIQAGNNQKIYDKELKITNFMITPNDKVGDNESSIVTLLAYGDFSMLFTGDAGIYALNQLKSFLPQNITVFKVGHHGASRVINKELFNYLNPKYSIVSTGENKFGHPSAYTMEIIKNSTVLRSDIHNAIKISVSPKKYAVMTYDNKKHKFEVMK